MEVRLLTDGRHKHKDIAVEYPYRYLTLNTPAFKCEYRLATAIFSRHILTDNFLKARLYMLQRHVNNNIKHTQNNSYSFNK